MDLLKLFTRDESIAGIEISDSFLRVALLGFEKKKSFKKKAEIREVQNKNKTEREIDKKEEKWDVRDNMTIKTLGEKLLKEGVIADGMIKNKEEFIKSLNDLLKEIKPRINYAVVSLPADGVYSRLYFFPKTFSSEKVEETMKLTVGFQLPVKIENVYLDWEKAKIDAKNEVFLAAVSKKVVDDYLNVFTAAGLKTVAVEFAQMSFLRTIDVSFKAILAIVFSKSGLTVCAVENKVVRFSRFLPKNFFPETGSLLEEIRKLIDFYESENFEGKSSIFYGADKNFVSEIILIGVDDYGLEKKLADKFSIPVYRAKILKEFMEKPEIKKDGGNKWLIAVGAALRGVMPRFEDNLVSLMPVGTEEAYENQKAVAFSEFISNITVGLSVFFGVVFVSVWILMLSVQQNIGGRLSQLGSLPVPAEAAEMEKRAVNFNVLLEKVNGILAATPKWSVFIEELKTRIVEGIYITNLSVGSPADAISITGAAKNRTQLNAFKKSLEDSAMFAEVSLPITNIGVKENIPFSVSFRLKDPGILMQIKN